MGKSHENVTARTRLVVPRIATATVERTALLARLDAAERCDLVLVAAAPGSGKTALLTQWAESLDVPVAWLSCDVDDADPSWFWRDVITAIRAAWTEVPLGDGELTEPREGRQLAIEIANELAMRAQPGVVIIDDFHLAAPEPAAIVAFIDALPPGVRLVLGTRQDPLVPLGRMRLQGRLLELRQSDLRFTGDEVAQALANLGVVLDRQDIDRLSELTEGWAAGVHLAGLSLHANPDREMLLKRLVATEHSLVDFLMNEVIDLQTPTMQDFLIETAELDTFDAALCDAALERSDSRELLDSIRSANLFLIGLDDGWLRYHHLFGEFLRARLRRVDPRRPATIHRSAAAAFAARGDVIAAIRHSMAAGDIATAMQHLTLHMATSTTLDDQSVGGAVARAWLDRHGLAELATAPQTVLACVIALNGANLSDEAAVWLERVGANEAALDDASRCMLHQTRCFHLLYQGDPSSALECAERAQAIVDAYGIDSVWVAAMPTQVLQAQLWLGDAIAAGATIDHYRPAANHSPVVSTVRMPGYASQVEVLRGDFVAAQRLAEQSQRAAVAISLPVDAFGMAEPAATLAEVALEQDRLSEAEAHIEHLMRIVDNGRRPLLELKGHLLLAQLATANGDDVVVDLHLDRARHILPNAASVVVAHIDRADLLQMLRRRDLPAATVILRRLPPCLETDLLAARLLVRSGDHAGAAAALPSPSELGTPRLLIQHGMLSALATAPTDLDGAQARLHGALGLASAMGYHQTIVDEGPELWTLLRSLPDDRDLTDYVGQLLAAADGALLANRRSDRNDLVEPLSDRELTVLRYLTSRLDGTEIAAALYVSINTVRSHFKAIYRKLGVNSRQEAVEHARALGLI